MSRLGGWLETHGVQAVAALAIIDVVTLAITLVIALNQGAALDEAIARGCHNAGALIQKNEQDLEQSTPALYRTFFPDVPRDQLRQIIAQQRQHTHDENAALATGCTPEQLRVTSSG